MPKMGRGGQEVIKDFGKPKEFKEKIQILNGRYGVYLKCGKTNVSIAKDTDLEKFSIDDALSLLEEKFKDKKIIKIDPGAAFGTGSHPSTYLCLEKMENIFFSDKKVLDFGSGSGILSVAARLLGAKEVCALDNDYLAINSTKSNFQLNFGNLNKLNTYLGSFNEVIFKNQLEQFDFVLCNILAEVIKGMIPNIYKCLRNNGEVIFSGILNSQKDEIIKILIQHDLKLLDVSTRKDWACISAQKASNPT